MKILTVLLVLGLMTISLPVFADTVADHLGDALTGKNQYIETNMYMAKTISLENVPYAKALNSDLRIKASTPIGNGSFRSGVLEIGLEF